MIPVFPKVNISHWCIYLDKDVKLVHSSNAAVALLALHLVLLVSLVLLLFLFYLPLVLVLVLFLLLLQLFHPFSVFLSLCNLSCRLDHKKKKEIYTQKINKIGHSRTYLSPTLLVHKYCINYNSCLHFLLSIHCYMQYYFDLEGEFFLSRDFWQQYIIPYTGKCE